MFTAESSKNQRMHAEKRIGCWRLKKSTIIKFFYKAKKVIFQRIDVVVKTKVYSTKTGRYTYKLLLTNFIINHFKLPWKKNKFRFFQIFFY